MAKSRKAKKSRSSRSPEDIAAVRRLLGHGLIAVLLIASLAVGFMYVRRYVVKDVIAMNDPPIVLLKNRPVWMSDFLADTIAMSVRPDTAKSPMDQQILVDAAQALNANPWIKKVNQLRRVYAHAPGDTIEVDCDYRAPVALVKYQDQFTFIDENGIILPDQFSAKDVSRVIYGADGRVNVRMIEGVAQRPTAAGKVWQGDDLRAGVELVKLLAGQPFAEDVLKVNVANYQGRRDPKNAHLVLITRYLTEIRWGRAPSSKDAFVEVRPEVKLSRMQQIFNQYKRVDAKLPWLDLRFDGVVYPLPGTASTSGDAIP